MDNPQNAVLNHKLNLTTSPNTSLHNIKRTDKSSYLILLALVKETHQNAYRLPHIPIYIF